MLHRFSTNPCSTIRLISAQGYKESPLGEPFQAVFSVIPRFITQNRARIYRKNGLVNILTMVLTTTILR